MFRELPIKAALLVGAMLSLSGVAASGADLGLPMKAPSAPPPFSWTGCYAGIQGGGGWGQKDFNDAQGALAPITGFTTASLHISGYVVGGQGGCDYQFAPNWVLGIEGAALGGNIGGSTTVPVPGDNATFKDTTDFLGSVTGRVGYAWDRWMLYAKGGAAWASDRYRLTDVLNTYAFDGQEGRIGWVAGGGIEWALWEDWSIKLEYNYYGFGRRDVNFIDTTISGGSGPESVKQNVQTVTLGVNFHVYAGQ